MVDHLHGEIQGSDSPIQHLLGEIKTGKALTLPQQVEEEVDWLDAVPVEIPPQSAQDNDHNISVSSTQPEMNYSEIPQLESDIDKEEEGQFEDIQTYLDNHNTYQESQNICKEYTKRLLDLHTRSSPYTSYPNRTTLHDARTHTNIRQRKRTSLQGRTSWAPILWSLHLILTEQDSKEN